MKKHEKEVELQEWLEYTTSTKRRTVTVRAE